jgi:hypothetical protein
MNPGSLKQQVAVSLALLAMAWLAPPAAHAQSANPTFRAASSAATTSGTLVIAQPAATAVNDVMIASIGVRPSSATVTAPAGWTLVRRINNASATANALAVYRKVAGAEEPGSYAWAVSGASFAVGGIQAFFNVDTASPIDVENGQTTASGLDHSTPSVTTTLANTMVVTSHTFSSSRTWTPPAGMTESFDQSSGAASATGQSIAGNRVLQAGAGATGVKTATAAADADVGNTHILALRPATTGPTPTPFTGTPIPVPGSFEAENFDLGGEGVAYHDNTTGNAGGQYRLAEDVDIILSSDPLGGGYVVNDFETGEWLAYTINVAISAAYDVEIRASSTFSTGAFHVEIDGVNVTGPIAVPNTGSWSVFQWVGKKGVPLAAGQHVFKIVADQQYFNLNSLRLIQSANPTFRAASSAATTSGTLVIAQPAATAVNDVMIASIGVRPSSATLTPPEGWTLVRRINNASGNTNALAVYRKVVSAAEPGSYSWTLAGSTHAVGGIQSFSGVDTASPIDVENGQTTASGLDHSTPSVTTTLANTMVVTSHTFASSRTWTPPAGMTESFDQSSGAASSAGQSIAGNRVLQAGAGATGVKTATAAADADVGNTHILALRPATTGPTPTPVPGSFEAVNFRAASSAATTSGTLVIAQPAATAVNDVMIASIGVRPSSATLTPPEGWTLVRRINNASGNTNALAVYRKVVSAAEPGSYSWTLAGSTHAVGGIQSFSGVDTASPIDVENGQTTASGLDHSTPSVTTTLANTMVVTSHTFASSRTWTPPAGMTESFDQSSGAASSAGQSIAGNRVLQAGAGATGVKTATAAADADVGNTHILALRPATTGPTPTPFTGTPIPVPGSFEAENFDLGGEGVAYHDNTTGNAGGQYRHTEDVDIILSSDPLGGGYVVNDFESGEWLAYTINVAQTATYRIEVRASSPFSNSAFHIEIDGVNATGSMVVPNTSSFSVFQNVGKGGVALGQGRHILRLVADQQYFDVNWIRITQEDSRAVTGEWASVAPLPFYSTALHLLPTGMVMFYGGNSSSNPGTDPRLWDPATASTTALPKPGYDIFCSGHAFLADGRLLVVGGGASTSSDVQNSSTYDAASNVWKPGPNMNDGRWYPTAATLANGDLLVVSGNNPGGVNSLPQVFQATSGAWRDLTNAQLMLDLYPRMHLAPNGNVFISAPSQTTRYLNTSGTGAWTFVATRNLGQRNQGSSVMYGDGKVLVMGGADPPTKTAEVIDLNAPSPSWRSVASMAFARRHLSATLLPDGKVLVTGGTSGSGFNNTSTPVYAAEMWDPGTESWTTMASAQAPRLYHSAALLLPDGRVLTTGGDGITQVELYSPPYLFAGARPTITSAPATVSLGQSFFVETPEAASIARVTWIRLPSVTHSFDMNQRINSLSFSQAPGGLNVVAPSDANLAPPGHYMLFLLNGNGVPSVATMVRLGS